jgi:hypothetical protein
LNVLRIVKLSRSVYEQSLIHVNVPTTLAIP